MVKTKTMTVIHTEWQAQAEVAFNAAEVATVTTKVS